jgi:hypothetical protein
MAPVPLAEAESTRLTAVPIGDDGRGADGAGLGNERHGDLLKISRG